MTEQERKDYMRKYVCPECIKKMREKNPYMIDCAFKRNNDEHLCDKKRKQNKNVFHYIDDGSSIDIVNITRKSVLSYKEEIIRDEHFYSISTYKTNHYVDKETYQDFIEWYEKGEEDETNINT